MTQASLNLSLESLLHLMIEKGASDLHNTAGSPPHLRVDNELVPVGDGGLSPEQTRTLTYQAINETQQKRFEEALELDFAFGIAGLSRFRGNCFVQRGAVGLAIRAIPYQIRNFAECGLPEKVVIEFCRKPRGLVLVTGATGSGKSTSLASMINWINQERTAHIVTIEDPVEYTFRNQKALIDQREVGSDTRSFEQGLRHVLRQDPNVILIGEMRDLETVEAALNIAETGHLVFATLHTSDSVQTINRIIDVFPSHRQPQVRTQLSFVLLGVLCQQLIPKVKGGRVLACEVMVANHAVRSLVRESKAHQMYSIIQTGQKEGMRTMNQSLYELYTKNTISLDEALSRTTEVEDLERMIMHK
ncbi:MAG: type IV pilus twitching motility protein PilT [Candidatus Omnitrophica bacterium]|nr:type IV pilus twitching motility protein PilT [Candidatus Omnitrophota bacterium]